MKKIQFSRIGHVWWRRLTEIHMEMKYKRARARVRSIFVHVWWEEGGNKMLRINKEKNKNEKKAEKTVVYAGARLHFFPVYSDHAQQFCTGRKKCRGENIIFVSLYVCMLCIFSRVFFFFFTLFILSRRNVIFYGERE